MFAYIYINIYRHNSKKMGYSIRAMLSIKIDDLFSASLTLLLIDKEARRF